MQGSIDIVVNLFTPDEVQAWQTGFDASFTTQVRMPERFKTGVSIDEYLKKRDRAGIERSLLIVVRAGDLAMRGSFEIPYAKVAHWCERYPDRFSGLAGIDIHRGTQGLRDLEQGVENEIAVFVRFMTEEPYGKEGYAACREGREPFWKRGGATAKVSKNA